MSSIPKSIPPQLLERLAVWADRLHLPRTADLVRRDDIPAALDNLDEMRTRLAKTGKLTRTKEQQFDRLGERMACVRTWGRWTRPKTTVPCKEVMAAEKAAREALVEQRSEGDRPDFGGFAQALRSECRWIAEIKSNDKTGQAVSDQAALSRLADDVERIGRRMGYL